MKTYQRECPDCSIILIYANTSSLNQAIRKNARCKSCATRGERNPFYGKTHSAEAVAIITEANKKRVFTTEDLEEKTRILRLNSNTKFPYEIWMEKYGKEEADRRMNDLRKKHSENNKGSGNPMFGKPAPNGSGNGWSGWYKGWFFRSLRELSFMINVIEKGHLSWETGELKKYKIEYVDWDGKTRNYFPDFIIGNKMIECKPTKLHNTPKVLLKKEAAEKFCLENNLAYELVDPPILSSEDITHLHDIGAIKFTDKYEAKYLEMTD